MWEGPHTTLTTYTTPPPPPPILSAHKHRKTEENKTKEKKKKQNLTNKMTQRNINTINLHCITVDRIFFVQAITAFIAYSAGTVGIPKKWVQFYNLLLCNTAPVPIHWYSWWFLRVKLGRLPQVSTYLEWQNSRLFPHSPYVRGANNLLICIYLLNGMFGAQIGLNVLK